MIKNTEQIAELPKAEIVRNLLRANIVNGTYCPGKRLPTFVEMECEFAVGRAVLQQALASLKRDGFIRSVNRQGLYVAASPPHLHKFGVVLAASPEEPGWTQLMTALSNEARRIEKSDSHANFRFYCGVQNDETYEHVVAQLREDILSFRLAGVFLTPKTYHLLDHPSLAKLRVPRVYFWAPEDSNFTPRVGTDGIELVSRALHHLRENGRRRVAVLHMADTTSSFNHKALYAKARLEFHTPWVQRIGRSHPQYAQDVISLLMDYRFDVRPDGLIIADDNLVDPVLRGLVGSGIKIGQDLEIVAHCNWPWQAQSIFPMTRIGFDISEVLRSAMESIALQREGQTPPASHQVRAQFEHEVAGTITVIQRAQHV